VQLWTGTDCAPLALSDCAPSPTEQGAGEQVILGPCELGPPLSIPLSILPSPISVVGCRDWADGTKRNVDGRLGGSLRPKRVVV
jgi:hypothetical protein